MPGLAHHRSQVPSLMVRVPDINLLATSSHRLVLKSNGSTNQVHLTLHRQQHGVGKSKSQISTLDPPVVQTVFSCIVNSMFLQSIGKLYFTLITNISQSTRGPDIYLHVVLKVVILNTGGSNILVVDDASSHPDSPFQLTCCSPTPGLMQRPYLLPTVTIDVIHFHTREDPANSEFQILQLQNLSYGFL